MTERLQLGNVVPATWRPMSHIGLEGDREGLCGAPTLGIPASSDALLCPQCEELWRRMSPSARWMFGRRR